MKVVFTKLDLNAEAIARYETLLKKIKRPFVMEISNYTTKIIAKGYNLHFVKSEHGNRVFSAYAKIKADLKDKPLPVLDMERNCYYDTSFKGDAFYSDRVYNIDIKCAYCTILLNAGYITQKTFDYINKLPKEERLAALGMLASRKDIFHHNARGYVVKMEERISPLSNFFYYCVQKTEDIIQSCKNQILMDSFLFSWVNGIYYLNDNANYQKITQDHLKKDFNLESSFKLLTDFEVKLKNDFYKISFNEPDNPDPKKFNIPLPESYLKKRIIHHLLTKNYRP